MRGMDYNKKSFSVPTGSGESEPRNIMTEEDRTRVIEAPAVSVEPIKKKTKRIIPFATRILVKRMVIGEKLGSGILYAAEDVAGRHTELAEVVFVPDLTFADKELLGNSNEIIKGLTEGAVGGDPEAYEALMKFRDYLNQKAIKPGDKIFIGKYVGTSFEIQETGQYLTLVNPNDIIGLVVEND